MSSSCQSIATAASSAATTTAAAVSISVSNATSVGSLIAAACMQQPQQLHGQQQLQQQAPTSHYVNGTGSLGRLKYHHKSGDASDEELEYTQVCGKYRLIEPGRGRSGRCGGVGSSLLSHNAMSCSVGSIEIVLRVAGGSSPSFVAMARTPSLLLSLSLSLSLFICMCLLLVVAFVCLEWVQSASAV